MTTPLEATNTLLSIKKNIDCFAQRHSLFAAVNYAQIKCSSNSEILFLQKNNIYQLTQS
jgi:hypothetical protein